MVNETEFFREIRKGIPKYQKRKPRIVPAFSIQSLQENTIVKKPPKCYPYEPVLPKKRSSFVMYYERGVFPISLRKDCYGGLKIQWKVVDIGALDYQHYLPMFFDGLTETESPYKQIVRQAISDMLDNSASNILPVVPQLIVPIKKALNTKLPEIICATMKALQHLVRSENCIGVALVPYFRQILPVMNLLKDRNNNIGGAIDCAQQRGRNPSDLIIETLEIFERYGGKDAFINIKYMVPTYESCLMNSVDYFPNT